MSFLDYLNNFAQTAGDVYGSVSGANRPTAAPAPAPAPQRTNWLPWAIGGGLVLIVLVVIVPLLRRG